MGNKKGYVWLGFFKVEMYWYDKVLYRMIYMYIKLKDVIFLNIWIF